MELLLGDPSKQTWKYINCIFKTPSREKFAAFLQTPVGAYLKEVCNSVVQLAAACFPKVCKNMESGQWEVADSTLQFCYTESCWREVKMMPATVGATISSRNAAHQASLCSPTMAALIIEEDMQWTQDAVQRLNLAITMLSGRWEHHMFLSVSHGESANHTSLVANCPTIYHDNLYRVDLKKKIPCRTPAGQGLTSSGRALEHAPCCTPPGASRRASNTHTP